MRTINWREQIEAQITELRVIGLPGDADIVQALLDVAVAADSALFRKHMRGEIYAGHTVDALERTLDKLREVGDE